MADARPVRLQLSRRKGFDLQQLSLAFNGLGAVNVARPGAWGNPFVVTEKISPGRHVGGFRYLAVPTAEDAVECFREMMASPGDGADDLRSMLPSLRGKNLACWCKLPTFGEPDVCHAAVLLELANMPMCEEVR
jgi:hypothetical protein